MFASLNDVAASVSALSQPDEEMREQARRISHSLQSRQRASWKSWQCMAGWRDEICPSINRLHLYLPAIKGMRTGVNRSQGNRPDGRQFCAWRRRD